MAKKSNTDPVIDAMCEAHARINEALVTHAMSTGGPDLALRVITHCISEMSELKESILSMVQEVANEMASPQEGK